MSCNIQSSDLYEARDINRSPVVNTSFIEPLLDEYDDSISGIWLPLVVKASESDTKWCDLLASASLENTSKFDPCACSDDIFGEVNSVSDIFNAQEKVMDDLGECGYCSSSCDSNPCDMQKGDNPDKEFCDVRFNVDDYVPKIPYIYQGYISGFNDFKHFGEFPSTTDPSLGCEKFITMGVDPKQFSIFGEGKDKIYIDWKLQESISEIPYDEFSSQHETEYIHNKSFTKSKMNKTCGNFLQKSQLLAGKFPNPQDYGKPYGFANQTYDNLYQGRDKIGSHWKWNYQSGIMGWYRHFDTKRTEDKRPIKGIDLYIPPGDIFYAKNQGPEISDTEDDSLACPSGLKIVNGTNFDQIIPNGTDFVYISSNIYPHFLRCRDRISDITDDEQEILSKSVLLATHPEYDNIVTDLYGESTEERNNVVGKLSTLNQFMTSGTDFVSAGNLNYCRTTDDLVRTLLHKYGCYYFVESNKDVTIRFDRANLAEGLSFYADLSFDMVINKKDNIFNLTSSTSTDSKFLPNQQNYLKKFEYNQQFGVGDSTIARADHNAYSAYNESCNEGKFESKDEINLSVLSMYDTVIATLSNNSGQYSFTDLYQGGNLQHDRIYPATAFNPHIDLIAVHPQGGAYINSLPFGTKQTTFFKQGINKSPGGPLFINFTTKDCGIKIYNLSIGFLQSEYNSSKLCERFPYSQEEKCKCYGFNLANRFEGRNFIKDVPFLSKGNQFYVPNLSTENSPTLKTYGGYSKDYLIDFFGSNGISSTQLSLAEKQVQDVSSYIDPLAPYGTEQSESLILPNYVNDKFTINTKNLDSSKHVDIIVSVNENVSLTANRFSGDPSNDEYTSNHNMSWKRFTTKVEVKNKVLYNRQSDEINVNEGDSFTIKLTNPFLAALINDTENSYAPPDNSVNLTSFMPALFSSRGDETSAVTLTFTRRPKKHLLNFVIPPPNLYGSLESASFDPNKGLSFGANGKSPFINNRLYYEYWFDNGGTEKLKDNKALLTSITQDNMKKLCHQISDFKLNRKLRLYLGFGGGLLNTKARGTFYKVNRSSAGKHVVNNKEYIGKPQFFEYIRSRINSQNIPMIYPAPPKKLFAWNFLFNHADINKDSVTAELANSYPQINGRDFNIDRDFLTFGGSRYYFAVEEVFNVISLSKTTTDPEFPEEVFEDPLESIENIEDGGIDNLPEKAGTIIKIKELYYFYNGGPNNKVNSYILLGKTFEEIVSNSSNLEIDFKRDLSETGYVYNSLRECNHPIIVYINNNGLIIPNKERYKIVKKELRVQGYNDNNQPTILNPVKYRLYTRLRLNHDLGRISNKVFAVDISNKDNNASLCVFHADNTTDYSDVLRIDQHSNNSRRVKWSHLKNLTDPDEMTDLIVEDLSIKSRFPPSPYNNWFYKQIINNFESRCDFQLYIRNTLNGTINFDNYYYYSDIDPTYCILQKYNLQKASVLPLKDAFLYQNFIPMMDINLFNPFGSNPDFEAMRNSTLIAIQEGFFHMVTKPPSFTNAGAFFGASPQVPEEIGAVGRDASNIGIPIEGLIYSPNWSRELLEEEFEDDIIPPSDLPSKYGDRSERFWTEIEEDDTIETAYYPKSTIYSETLRIDDPTFWLDKVSNQTTFNTAGVRTTFKPAVPSMSSAGEKIRGFEHTIQKRDYAFRIDSIYGDGDKITECGAQGSSSCFMSTRGDVSSYAYLKIATPTETSRLPGSNPDYFVTYDAGLYNPLGQKNLITINRAELDVDNPLDSAFDDCSTEYVRPSYTRTVFDPEKNKTIKQAAKRSQSQAVDDLDAYANEMLFRIMYGDEPDPVNRNILLSKKKPLSIDDLVNFTDPKITAADIYDEILYNYDIKAGCGDFVNNSFTINGTSNPGDSYSLSVGNTSIYITIVDLGGNDGVWAYGNVGTEKIDVRLSARPTMKTGMRVTDVNTTLSNTDTTTYTYKKTSKPGKTKLHGYVAGRVYTGRCTIWDTSLCYNLHHPVQWGSWPADVNTEYGTDSEILTEHWLNPTEANLYNVEIVNCAKPGLSTCGGNPYPSYQLNQCSNYTDPTCPDDTCNDYEIGYCRRKEDCADKTGCYVDEKLDNFLYTFEQCRTTFHVYGHARKKLATGTPELDDEDLEQFKSDECGGDCPEPHPLWLRRVKDEDGNFIRIGPAQYVMEPDPDSIPETYGCQDLAGGRVTLVDGNLGGGWRGAKPWVRGHARSLCGGGSPNAPSHVGGNGGFGYMGYGRDLALIPGYAPRMPDALRAVPKDMYGCYLYPGNREIGKWQYENLVKPCQGTTDSPISMDPGYDMCGTVARYVTGPAFKYYTFREVTDPAPYDGSCPRNLFTVKYTNQSVTVTINGEDICTSSAQAGCPELNIQSMPEHSHIASETINNDGGDDANIEINIPPQTQNYQTIRYRHKQYLSQMAGADVNYVSEVGTQAGICNRATEQQCCVSQSQAVCGENAAAWGGVFVDGGTVPDSKGTWGQALEIWKEMCRNTFNDIDMEPTSSSWYMPGFRLTQGTVSALERPRRLCNANRHISSADIVQGIVPGTCSSLQFETTYKNYTRWRVANEGGFETQDSSDYATVKAYVEYDYIRPATIQDKLKGWSPDSDSYACAQESSPSNASDEYPDWYARLLRVETSIPGYFFNYDNQQNKGGVANYIRRKQIITRASYCGDSLTTYDPEDYNKDGDRNYPFGGAPCGRDDYLCWADNRDWISVWME